MIGLRARVRLAPALRGSTVTKPNRVEVVFSEHDDVIVDQQDHAHEVRVPAWRDGYVVGEQPTTLLRVGTYSDTLEMYPDLALLREAAGESRGFALFALQPTLSGQPSLTFGRDAVVLGVAHVLRRACMNRRTITDVEASGLARVLADRLVTLQYGEARRLPAPRQLNRQTIDKLAEFIETGLTGRLTLEALARVAELSPFHFARCFKATTGLAPHQYVLARRIELAKRLIMTTRRSVQEIAWSVGFENISHFRRQFAAQIGAVPGALRRATRRD